METWDCINGVGPLRMATNLLRKIIIANSTSFIGGFFPEMGAVLFSIKILFMIFARFSLNIVSNFFRDKNLAFGEIVNFFFAAS